MGVIGCYGDGEPRWRADPGSCEAGWNCTLCYVWLQLSLDTGWQSLYLVACIDQSFGCPTHGSMHHACINPSRFMWEEDIKETEVCGIEAKEMVRGAGNKQDRSGPLNQGRPSVPRLSLSLRICPCQLQPCPTNRVLVARSTTAVHRTHIQSSRMSTTLQPIRLLAFPFFALKLSPRN